MSKITVMGTFICQDGRGEEMEAVLALMADESSMQHLGRSAAMQAAVGLDLS